MTKHIEKLKREESENRSMKGKAIKHSFLTMTMCAALCMVMYFSKSVPQQSVSANLAAGAGAMQSQQDSHPTPDTPDAPPPTPKTEPDIDEWNLLLVSIENPLPQNFTVDLQKVQKDRVDKRIATALLKMLSDAKKQKIILTISSAYRGAEAQESLYEETVAKYRDVGFDSHELEESKRMAEREVQPPGMSEHHTGLAIDFTTMGCPKESEKFAGTDAYKWLSKHAEEYGFVERYPKDKEEVTSTDWQPWHFRYVGEEHAQNMNKSRLCLEEYIKTLEPPAKETIASPDALEPLKPENTHPESVKPAAPPEKPEEVQIPKPLDKNEWNLLLVSTQKLLPQDFTVDLQRIQSGRVDKRIALELSEMMKAAKKDGISLTICSAFRDVKTQKRLYENKVAKYQKAGYDLEESRRKAGRYVQPPGASEHHTGLAADFLTPSYNKLDDRFANTNAYKWLSKHAGEYGFIERYPKDKEKITGIAWEPWHFRYVGKEHARNMKEAGVCLEEYLA